MLPDNALKKTLKDPSEALPYIKNNLMPFDDLERLGWRGFPCWGSKMAHRYLVSSPKSTSAWEREWDLLIVLDACRRDWMIEVENEYEFISSVDDIWSVGSHSTEWVEQTFSDTSANMLSRTSYITANHYSKKAPKESFAYFDDLSVMEFNKQFASVPAHIVTDRAIKAGRELDIDHQIVHYMQPHKPFFEKQSGRYDVTVKDWSIGFKLYKNYFSDEISKDKMWGGFINNLRYVLDEVSILLRNTDAEKVAITADHGNSLGERFLWDHHPRIQHPTMRRVPWVETSASDEKTLTPRDYSNSNVNNSEIKRRLKVLGYQ